LWKGIEANAMRYQVRNGAGVHVRSDPWNPSNLEFQPQTATGKSDTDHLIVSSEEPNGSVPHFTVHGTVIHL